MKQFRPNTLLACEETWVLGEKPLGARARTNNRLNPHMTPNPKIKPEPHWWGRGIRIPGEKSLGEKDENQQHSQPIYDTEFGNRIWQTLVGAVDSSTRRNPLGARTRTNNKLNPHMIPSSGIESDEHWWGPWIRVPGVKPLGARTRTNNKLNPHMIPSSGIESDEHWWGPWIRVPGVKPLGARTRTNNKLNPDITPSPRIEPGPRCGRHSFCQRDKTILSHRRKGCWHISDNKDSLHVFWCIPFQAGCTAIAVLLHYFLLALFSWMLCEGVLLYILLVKVFGGGAEEKVKYFYVFGWGRFFSVIAVWLSFLLLISVSAIFGCRK